MTQSLIFTLLALALVLPVLGAVGLRLLAPHITMAQLYGAAGLIFAVAFGSVLLLARADVSSIQIGQLSLLLPAAGSAGEPPAIVGQTPSGEATSRPAEPTEAPTGAPARTATPAASATVAATATAAATATPEPPATPEPTATATPEPPTETAQPTGRRTYVVQPGDTLRAIAEQFDVTVQALLEANNLTPEQADSLRPGQELVIP
jgi:LysM repeat protein